MVSDGPIQYSTHRFLISEIIFVCVQFYAQSHICSSDPDTMTTTAREVVTSSSGKKVIIFASPIRQNMQKIDTDNINNEASPMHDRIKLPKSGDFYSIQALMTFSC